VNREDRNLPIQDQRFNQEQMSSIFNLESLYAGYCRLPTSLSPLPGLLHCHISYPGFASLPCDYGVLIASV
jgi:hypothetical protein